jgi:hypothetical protein
VSFIRQPSGFREAWLQAEKHSRLLLAERDAARARVAELEQLINTPHTGEFVESVQREAAHQVERWGTEHDAGKAPSDWFWLVGFLLGKALHFPEKRKHHLVSSAAALLNWYRAETGDSTAMRPGIDPPDGAAEVPA